MSSAAPSSTTSERGCCGRLVLLAAGVRRAKSLECSVSFEADGKRVNGGLSARPAYSGRALDDLRTWIAHHPPGSALTLRYDPSRPATTELADPPQIFDLDSPRLFLKVAGVVQSPAFCC